VSGIISKNSVLNNTENNDICLVGSFYWRTLHIFIRQRIVIVMNIKADVLVAVTSLKSREFSLFLAIFRLQLCQAHAHIQFHGVHVLGTCSAQRTRACVTRVTSQHSAYRSIICVTRNLPPNWRQICTVCNTKSKPDAFTSFLSAHHFVRSSRFKISLD